MAMIQKLCVLSLVGCGLAAHLRNSTAAGALVAGAGYKDAKVTPCQCVANDPTWKATTRTVPKCIFIDLGAAHGNSFQQFLANDYGPVANCPNGQWEAILVEANPQFDAQLATVATTYPGAIHVKSSTAAYMCPATTSFAIDPDVSHNRWGSSMKATFDGNMVTVPTINVNQLIAENVLPGDWVMLKVDIEGAEYDVIPCLAQFTQLNKLDIIFMEEHGWLQGDSAYTPAQFNAAKASIAAAGVKMPAYNSPTM